MKKIRFGIIGAGMIGPFHAEAICGLDDAELIGVATTREQTAKPFAEKFGARTWYIDYHQLLQRRENMYWWKSRREQGNLLSSRVCRGVKRT
ncbi:MAG: Gfo/Idh/MocA family oxidoreductase [Candidatus Aerophobus sp.]|nr:MAG: Gfo/Idh/MocA family oxidoreductase [Candidatus Aerophobus sp.]